MAFITEWNQTAGAFTLPLRTGYTYNMVVDWGDGSATSTVTAYNDAAATHTYAAGTFQISITGTCGSFYINNAAATKLKLTKVIDWGNVGFTGLGLQAAFYGCSNLTVLPAGSITGANACTSFHTTFKECTGLAAIPAGFFNNNTAVASSAFLETFYGCTGITSIPTDLFRYNTGASVNAFSGTFQGCTGITSIPEDLFRYNLNSNVMFQNCFYGCTGLPSIPAGLFQYNTAINGINTFNSTFKNCTNITAIPADLFRYNTFAKDFSSCFYGCAGLPSIPVDLFRYNTAVTAFGSTFYNCLNLSGEIPIDLFRYNTAVTSFTSCFRGCTSLPSISTDLFRYNTLVTTFYYCFYGCTSLVDIPENLFRYNINCTSFDSVFFNCSKLKLKATIFYAEGEQASRFLNKSVIFANCFNRTSYTGIESGIAPDIWNCNYGTGTATKTNCFAGVGNSKTSISNYCFIATGWGAVRCARLESIGSARSSATEEKINVTTTLLIPVSDTFNCYVSTTLAGLESPENIIPLVNVNPTLYEAITGILTDGSTYYIKIVYSEPGGVNPESLSLTSVHYQVQQVPTTTINITEAENHVTFNAPLSKHSFNHGFIFTNGFLYGSARNYWQIAGGFFDSTCIFKLNASDYSIVNQITIFADLAQTILIAPLDQIVFCKGFLWCQGFRNAGYLVRINPDDLSYMVFNAPYHNHNQPIGTDGNYLYYTDNVVVNKLDTDLLIAAAATYGYVGNAVNLPVNTILADCTIIQYHPTYDSYSHSIAIDANFIYLALTTGALANGYDVDLDIYMFHFQKINKLTMETAGDVIIPRCTDDMVQNANYVFLAPEFGANSAIPLLGEDFGLLAINKETLELKYLKALHSDFNTVNELDRTAYGVFIYNNKITVQLVNSKKTIVINLQNVDQWGENFPIGGATDAIFKFQINGVDLAAPCNELVLDSSGWVHTNTWEEYTTVFKFSLSELGIDPISYNAVSLHNNDTIALLEFLDTHFGCSVRCVQEAPGIATGTTGTAQDQDGNVYDTVVINEKRWMVQNLKTTHFRNGDPVPNITDPALWELDEIGAQCDYNNKPANV